MSQANAINDRLTESAVHLLQTLKINKAWDGKLSAADLRKEFEAHLPHINHGLMLAADVEAPKFESTIEQTGCWLMMKSLIDNLDALKTTGDVFHRGENRDADSFSSKNFDTISKVFGGISRTVCDIGMNGKVDPSAVIDTITGSISDLMNSEDINKDRVKDEVLILCRTLKDNKKQYLGIRYHYEMHISDIKDCGVVTHTGRYSVNQTYVVAPTEDLFTEAYGKVFPDVTDADLEIGLTSLINRDKRQEIPAADLLPRLKKLFGSSLLDIADKPVKGPGVLAIFRIKVRLPQKVALALIKDELSGVYVKKEGDNKELSARFLAS